MKKQFLAAGVMLAGVAPALAAPIQFSGRADARAGYGSNPFLIPGVNSANPVLGFNITPTLRRVTGTGSTALTASYQREQYLNGAGHPDALEVVLEQIQQFTPDLSMTARGSYSTSTNALNNTVNLNNLVNPDPVVVVGAPVQPSIIDPLTIGLRTRRYQGSAGFTWRATNIDVFQLSGGYTHGLANGSSVGSYSFYNGGIGYTRTVSPRAQLGAFMGYSHTASQGFPAVSTYEPTAVLTYQFSEIWSFNGGVGASLRRVSGGRGKSTGLGFNLSLCGSYPTTTVCLLGARITSASGFGGARINTNFGVNVSHRLNSRDTASLTVNYVNSDAIGDAFAFGQEFTQVSGSFDHKLAPRWVVGLDGRFQTRTQDRLSAARALNATLHLSYLFGRLG